MTENTNSVEQIRRMVERELRSIIGAQGPITGQMVGLASKQIIHSLAIVQEGRFVRCAGFCWYCGTGLVPVGTGDRRKTVDHLIPRSRGGDSSQSNKVVCCHFCNQEKNSLTLEEYRAVISYRKGERAVFWGEIFGNDTRPPSVRSLVFREKLMAALGAWRRIHG